MPDAAETSYSSPESKIDVRGRLGIRRAIVVSNSEIDIKVKERETNARDRGRERGNKCVIIGAGIARKRRLTWAVSARFANLTVVRAKMNLSLATPIVCVLLVALLAETAYARPSNWLLSRQKRLSDQRLAELETLLALQNVKGVVVPVGFGKVNPAVLGRKRRSISEDNLRKLHHLLLLIAQDAESTADQSDQIRPLPWKEDPREEQRDYQLI